MRLIGDIIRQATTKQSRHPKVKVQDIPFDPSASSSLSKIQSPTSTLWCHASHRCHPTDPTVSNDNKGNNDGRVADEATAAAPAARTRKKIEFVKRQPKKKAVPILNKSSWAQLGSTTEAGHGGGGKETFANQHRLGEFLLRIQLPKSK